MLEQVRATSTSSRPRGPTRAAPEEGIKTGERSDARPEAPEAVRPRSETDARDARTAPPGSGPDRDSSPSQEWGLPFPDPLGPVVGAQPGCCGHAIAR